MLRNNATFTVKVEKIFPTQQGKGLKAQVSLQGGEKLFMEIPFDGEMTDSFKEGGVSSVVGTLRVKQGVKYPILTVQRKLNGGGAVTLIGRLTKDSELKYSKDGLPIANGSLAVNYGWGEQKETDFYNITVFGRGNSEKNAATSFAEHGAKGRRIVVVGRYSQNEYEGKVFNGVIADQISYLEPKDKTRPAKDDSPPDYSGWADVGSEVDGEDIPF